MHFPGNRSALLLNGELQVFGKGSQLALRRRQIGVGPLFGQARLMHFQRPLNHMVQSADVILE